MDKSNTITTNDTGCILSVGENTSRNSNFGVVGIYSKLSESNTDIVHNQHSSAPTKVSKVKSSSRKWMILSVCFVVQFMISGFVYSQSVLFVPFLEAFGKSKAETSLIQGVLLGSFCISGVPDGLLITKIGPRVAGMLGGFIAFIGVSGSYFANSISFLIVSLGLIGGIGTSLVYISSATCIGYNFQGNDKLLALAFITFGSGIGTIVCPYALEALSEEYGLSGCLLVSGGILANTILCAALFTLPTNELIVDDNINISIVTNISNDDARNKVTNDNTQTYKTKPPSNMSMQLRDIKGNKVFMVYGTGMAITYPTFIAFLAVITDFLQNSQGFDRNTTILLYLMMNISSTLSRIIPGGIKKCAPGISVILIQLMYTLVGAITLALFPFATTYTHHVVLVLTWGFMVGGTVSGMSVATMKLVGAKHYATAYGILLCIFGVGNIIAVPIAGYMVDATGTYVLFLYTSSSGLFLAALIFILAIIMRKFKNRQKHGMMYRSSVLPWKDAFEITF